MIGLVGLLLSLHGYNSLRRFSSSIYIDKGSYSTTPRTRANDRGYQCTRDMRITPLSYSAEASSELIDSRNKAGVMQLQGSASPPPNVNAKEARRQLDLATSEEILAIFKAEDTSQSYKAMEIGLLFIRSKKQLRRVHVLHILHECAKADIDVSPLIPLGDLATILIDSVHPMRAAEVSIPIRLISVFHSTLTLILS
jgi:hypothetical protein